MRRSTQLEKTAYHEAGHAVAAVLLSAGLNDEGVTIVPSEGQEGHCAVAGGRQHIQHVVTVMVAGHVAQNIFRSGSSNLWADSFSDLRNVLDLLGRICPADEPLWVDRTLKEVQRETRKFLLENWAAVEALAMALLERKTLTGSEAEAVVVKNFWKSERTA